MPETRGSTEVMISSWFLIKASLAVSGSAGKTSSSWRRVGVCPASDPRTNPILLVVFEGFDQILRRAGEGHSRLGVAPRRAQGRCIAQDADPVEGLAEARSVDVLA